MAPLVAVPFEDAARHPGLRFLLVYVLPQPPDGLAEPRLPRALLRFEFASQRRATSRRRSAGRVRRCNSNWPQTRRLSNVAEPCVSKRARARPVRRRSRWLANRLRSRPGGPACQEGADCPRLVSLTGRLVAFFARHA
jgi:hypothetical protein